MVWCGVAWRGVAWCGVAWCGVVWCGVAFFTEQSGVYGDMVDPTENLVEDFGLVPVIAECTNTAHLPLHTFVTKEMQGTERQKIIGALSGGIINTYFSYAGPIDK